MTADLPGRRRWPLVLGVIVLVLALGGAGFRYVFLAHWRPDLQAGERYGIDVSHHQGVINWDAVAGDGISFAYVKATEGEDWVDTRFAANWAGVAAAGIQRGAYHFFSLCTPGWAQAAHFLATVKPDPDSLAPAIDLELAGNCDDRPDQARVTAQLEDFVDAVEEAWGQKAVFYVGEDWEDVYPVKYDRQRWHRRFLFRPEIDWYIWQLHGFADVEGVPTRVDLDVMRP